MSAPGSSLPPRPAHLPAPPAFPLPPPSAPPRAGYASDYRGDARDERGDWYDYPAHFDDRKRRRSDASDYDRREPRPRIDDREDRVRLSTVPAIKDPEELETLVNKGDWVAWFRAKHPREVAEDEAAERAGSNEGQPAVTRGQLMQDRYDAYRKRFVSRQLYALFLIHKPSAWFEEKYSMVPEMVALRERVRLQARDGLAEEFIAQVNNGQWDGVSYDMSTDGEDRTEPRRLDTPSKPELEAGQVVVYPSPNQLVIKSLPVDVSRTKLEEATSKIAGYRRLALGPALEENRFLRNAWVTLEAGTDLAAAAAQLDGQQLPDSTTTLSVAVNDQPHVGKPQLAPEGSGTLDRLKKDLDQARQLIVLLQAETDGTDRTAAEHDGLKAIDSRMASYVAPEGLSEADADVRKIKFHLDLYITYLRKVFHTCYYSGSINDSREELELRSIKYLRKVPAPPAPAPAAATGNAADEKPVEDVAKVEAEPAKDVAMDDEEAELPRREGEEPAAAAPAKTAEQIRADSAVTVKLSDLNSLIWSQGVDSRIERHLNRATADPVAFGGKSIEQEQEKIIAGYIKQEDEGKYRCKECSKLFKGAEFVKKHVPNKHPELLKPLDTVRFFNNFVLDPLHVVPPAGAPASVNDQLPSLRPQGQASAAPAGFPPGTQFPPGFIAPWMVPPGAQGMLSQPYTPGFVGFGLNPYMQYGGLPGMVAGGSGGRGGPRGGGAPMGGGRYIPSARRQDGDARPSPVDTTIGRPAGVRDDPRARKGKIDYNDLDSNVPDGEVQLNY